MTDPIRFSSDGAAQIPPDALLADELSDDIVVDMANLTSAQTGIAGTILISTAMGAHGPRVKYFKEALLDFWHHADTWTQPEVNEFIQKLRRV